MTEQEINKAVNVAVEEQLASVRADLKGELSRLPYLEEKQKLEIARFAAASQWLIASLLAVNLAGLVFTGDREIAGPWIERGSAFLYFSGAIGALFAGLFYRSSAYWSQTGAKKDLGGRVPLNPKTQEPWTKFDIEHREGLFDKLAIRAGLVSFSTFLLGSVAVAIDFAGFSF